MKYLYKYPQAAFPYDDLVRTNRNRSRDELEYELLDTGVFNEDRYFDVFVEYAKGAPEDILIRITAHNRGPEAATLHLLPTLWFRNTWSLERGQRDAATDGRWVTADIGASHAELGERCPALRRCARTAVHGERNQQPAPVRRAQRHALRQGRHQRLHRHRPQGRGQSGAKRHQERGLVHDRDRRRTAGAGAAAAVVRRRGRKRCPRRSARASTQCLPRA